MSKLFNIIGYFKVFKEQLILFWSKKIVKICLFIHIVILTGWWQQILVQVVKFDILSFPGQLCSSMSNFTEIIAVLWTL